MKDVARKAGVSLGTVSKVMNRIPVGEATRKKVENAAKELEYQINSNFAHPFSAIFHLLSPAYSEIIAIP